MFDDNAEIGNKKTPAPAKGRKFSFRGSTLFGAKEKRARFGTTPLSGRRCRAARRRLPPYPARFSGQLRVIFPNPRGYSVNSLF